MLIGLAFGLVLMSSPLAIVSYFLVPTVVGILAGVVDALKKPFQWIDLSTAMGRLSDEHVGAASWARIGTAVALWLVVPLVIGMIRLSRHEVK